MKQRTRTTVLGLAASSVLFFAGAPGATAADCALPSPTADQYCPPPPSIERYRDPGSLPFTGYDVGFAALAAIGLAGAGIGLHRAARSNEG